MRKPTYYVDEIYVLEHVGSKARTIFPRREWMKRSPYVRRAIIDNLCQRFPNQLPPQPQYPNAKDYNGWSDPEFREATSVYYQRMREYNAARKRLYDQYKHLPIEELLSGDYRIRTMKFADAAE